MKNLIAFFALVLPVFLIAQTEGSSPDFGALDILMNDAGLTTTTGDPGGTSGVRRGSGGGENDLPIGIDLDWSDQGRLLEKWTKLEWKDHKGFSSSTYEVVITDSNDEEFYIAKVRGNWVKLPLHILALKAREQYSLQVIGIDEDGEEYASKQAKFSTAPSMLYHNAIQNARADSSYTQAGDLKKLLMESLSLESVGLKHEAHLVLKTDMGDSNFNAALEEMRRQFLGRAKISCLCQ